ncbi:MAG TPA: DUF4957 domain-containing protein [bacterium]
MNKFRLRIRVSLLSLFLMIYLNTIASAAEIQVSAGTDAISTALSGSSAGDILILITDGGNYTESSALIVDKAITIKAATGLTAKPIWTTMGNNHITLQSNVVLEGIIFEGISNPDTAESAIINSATIPSDLTINGCEFRNFLDKCICKQDLKVGSFDSVIVANSIFSASEEAIVLEGDHPQGAGQHADNVPGALYLSVEKCTFYNLEGGAIKLEAYVAPGDPVLANINYVTINNCKGETVYLKEVDETSKVTNSVITNCNIAVKVKYSPADLKVTYCDLWGNTIDFDKSSNGGCSAGVGIFSHDPWYKDAVNGDFNYAWSQFSRASSEKTNIGDSRWTFYLDGPPRLAVNTLGSGSIQIAPVGPYTVGDVVDITALPNEGSELIGWYGDTLNANSQITMEAHRYVAAQFAPVGANIVDINGTFSGNVDWSVVAIELKGSGRITFEEAQNGGVLFATAPETLTVTTDTTLKAARNDLYLAIISTKGHSDGHPHNTQVVDEVKGLGLNWEHVATERGSRNQTVLNIYKAQGVPTGDDIVSATLHNFPAGFCIALTVVRYSGVDRVNPIGNILSQNVLGFNGPVVEITGYPKPDARAIPNARPDNTKYSVKLPVSESTVAAFIAHRNLTHTPGEGFKERDEFAVISGGNTNSISVVDNAANPPILLPAVADTISNALAGASDGDIFILTTDGGIYQEANTVVIDKSVTIKAAEGLTNPPTWTTGGNKHITLQSDLTLEGIVFEGLFNSINASSAIINGATTPNNLTINGCEFRNFSDEIIFTEFNEQICSFDSVFVNNSLFHNSGSGIMLNGDHPQGAGQHADNIPGAYYLWVENCTLYNLANEGIKLEPYVPPGPPAVAMINHVTVNNCGAEGVYVKEVGPSSKITNSIITNCGKGVVIKYMTSLEVTYSDVWGNGKDYDGGAFAGLGCFSHDPWFVDAANGDFRFMWAQIMNASSEKIQIGDSRWTAYDNGPPRLAVNTIGDGTITIDPVKEVYNVDDNVTLTAAPNAGAEFIGWIGDTLNAQGQVTMDAHKYVTAQFAPAGSKLIEFNGTFSNKVDWSVVAMELVPATGSQVTFAEIQTGKRLEVSGDTLQVATDSVVTAVSNDLYLAAISTKGHSYGHSHNCTQVDSIWGLGLEWKHVNSVRGTRNGTHLEIYMAQGTPTGDDKVSVIVHNFPAGFCIALSVVRYTGVHTATPIGNIISHNSIGFNSAGVEITGLPRPASSYDKPTYSVKLPVTGDAVCAFIAHRNVNHEAGEGFIERSEFWVESGGNTNSITLVDKGVLTSVSSTTEKGIPLAFDLSQNYPNPFNPETMIRYQLPKACDVKLVVFNLKGQKVATLYNGVQQAGYHTIRWNGLDDQQRTVTSGIYFYRLEADSYSKTYKMLFVR